ncbi:MAG: DMT family transporter [Gammaproteobacteria bacterium]|nr:DMT family transporter [Gammaproteobacteria bacterium]
MAEAVSIVYLAPFAVMALAVPLLGEKLTAANWILASLGFGGVMLVINPEGNTSTNGILFALANAGCAAAFHLLSRVLSATESSISMLFYVTLAGVIGFAATGAIDTFNALPTLQDLGWMSLLGLIATTGHFLLSQAYRYAPASIVAPMNYLHIVWAAALGYLFFDETPGLWAAIGMVTIIGSGAVLAWQVNRNTPKSRPSN